ncbi:MAG: lipid II:glycine glycyltransferase FemX [Sarcina sp.]
MLKIIDCKDEKWNEYFKMLSIELQDIYYEREYYNLSELVDKKLGKLFFYKENDYIAFYPFLLNKIEGYKLDRDYYDIETAYGYGGPIINTSNKEFRKAFEEKFLDYCKENNIIAEFIRYHPILKNEKIFEKEIKVEKNRKTLMVDLSKTLEEIWMKQIYIKNRTTIRRVIKEGVKVIYKKNLDNFQEIYKETMTKVNADKYYYFSKDYFNYLKELDYIVIAIELRGTIISEGIFFKGKSTLHYHLSGSRKDYLKYHPNNLMLWEAIKFGKENGFTNLHLGGGLTNNLEDSLYKFKSAFTKENLDYYIGKRVHNEEVYNYLLEAYEKKYNKKSKLFLQYNFKE